MNFLTQAWPWYISGPLIGLMVPTLLLLGNKSFGISSTLRHICAACVPGKINFFTYDWKKESWNLFFAAGIILGGCLAGVLLNNTAPVQLSSSAIQTLQQWGIQDLNELVPAELFNFNTLFSLKGVLLIMVGGFLVGFGTRYAGGCTSGHSIMGLANLQWPSLVATCCFFAGGLIMSWFILPYILSL